MSTTPDLAFDPPRHTRHFIDGTWRTSVDGATLPVVDPSTETRLADVSAGSDADVEHAVQAASRAFPGWKRTTGAARAALLRAIARGVDAHRTRLATLQSLNNGKPFAEAEIDVADVIATFDYYAGLADRLDT
ncbi:aldehyde dehydrogenase family protein, partial [Burkholderia sp.]